MTDNSLNKNTAFASLPLQAELLTNLDALGSSDITPSQAQSLPEIVAGRDVLAQAKIGSGKTAAFALGGLPKLAVRAFRVQAAVPCATGVLTVSVDRRQPQSGRLVA